MFVGGRGCCLCTQVIHIVKSLNQQSLKEQMHVEKQAHGVYTQHFDCYLILHHSGPRTDREADDGLSSSASAISVSFMFCETRLKTLNEALEERDKTVLF